MDVLKRLTHDLYLLGIRETDGKYGARIRIYVTIQAIMMIIVLCYLQNRWIDLDERFIGLKAVLFILTFIATTLSLVSYWNEFSDMMVILKEMNFKIPYEVSQQRSDVIASMEKDMRIFSKLWVNIVVAYMISTFISPLAYVILKVLYLGARFQDTIKENPSTQYPMQYPKYNERFQHMEPLLNIVIYLFAYCIHTIYMLYNSICAHLANVTALCSMSHIEHELRLLRLSLVEMDLFLDQNASSHEETETENLKCFLRYFVKHHQNTYRKVRIVNRVIRWVTSIINFIASLYICLSVYTIVEKEELVSKIQEAVFFGTWSLGLYFTNLGGEKVKTEGENLRNALYECSWLEKPKWFKSCLLVAMTRSYQPIQLKPFGIISLNLNSFALTMNAAYSYYNILHNFKK